MNKIRIDGKDYVSVKDMRHAIRDCSRTVKETYKNFDSNRQAMVYLAYNDISKKLYEEELKNAHTPDEIKAILEMPGDYVVMNNKEKKVFCDYCNGIPEIKELKSKDKNIMIFDFKSKAEEVAKYLGYEWDVLDISKDSVDYARKFLDALFFEDDECDREFSNKHLKAFEKEKINAGIEAAKRCIEKHKDINSAMAIFSLCKMIAGDEFDVKVEID